jgi:SAM-dependent methyltransferase
MLVPAGALRALLRPGRRLTLRYTGFAFEPVIRDGDLVTVRALDDRLSPGMLVLCERDGWGDVVRITSLASDQATVGLDALPGRVLGVRRSDLLGTVIPAGRADPVPTRADRLRLLLRSGAVRFAWRRVERAPRFGPDAGLTVEEKYRQQVRDYREHLESNLTDEMRDAIRRHAGRGCDVLVGACGAGGEALDLCRAGFRVTAFDALPEMITATRQTLQEAGMTADLMVARVQDFDAGARRFGAIYFTPVLYSFVPGRAARLAALRRMARHLRPEGVLLFSVAIRGPLRRVQVRLAWLRRRLKGDRLLEPGDWYTWFMTPSGEIGTSYVHVFGSLRRAQAEVRAAGFGAVRPLGRAHLVATNPPATAPD